MSIIKDIFFGGAEKKAARAEERGITAGIEEEQRQREFAQEQFAPFLERGGLAGEREAEFLGLRGPEAEQAALAGFAESPGQVFLRERGERALLRSEAAIGGLGGGNVRTALLEQGVGFAGQFLGERLDRLRRVARGGLEATTAGADIGGRFSSNIARLFGERGRAKAGGILGRASGIRGGLSRIAGAFTPGGGSTFGIKGLKLPQPSPGAFVGPPVGG